VSAILIISDVVIWRDALAEVLRSNGYRVAVCGSEIEATLRTLKTEEPNLLLLDATDPPTGFALLRAVRASPLWRDLPVVMLTDTADKAAVIRARELHVQGYLLKSRIDLNRLLTRIGELLRRGSATPTPAADKTGAAPRADAGQRADQPASAPGAVRAAARSPSGPAGAGPPTRPCPRPPGLLKPDADLPLLSSREQTLKRVRQYLQAKTLAGVVAEVIRIASSPRAERSDLSAVLQRDPVLSARVLQVANAAAAAANRRRVQTIDDAIAAIGFSGVRNIASTVGVFDTFPPESGDHFNLLRCWQHCMAVGALMQHYAPRRDDDETAGVAYLIGLCHDLGEIILRQLFHDEYEQASRIAAERGVPVRTLERRLFGVPHDELIRLILEHAGLPDAISLPILAYFRPASRTGAATYPLTELLRVCDNCAHGLLLAATPEATVAPVTQTVLREAFGQTRPEPPDEETLRGEVSTTSLMLAGTTAADTAALARPMFPRRDLRIAYLRHPAYLEPDPVGTALRRLADVQMLDRLPADGEAPEGVAGLVVAAPRVGARGLGAHDLERCGFDPQRILFLTGRPPDAQAPATVARLVPLPVPLARLDEFIASLQSQQPEPAAAT